MDNTRILKLLLEKFSDKSETVISICDCYQIGDNGEHRNALLALVGGGSGSGTHALFAFGTTNWPPEFISDLNVKHVYRIDDTFRFETSAQAGESLSINRNRFTVYTSRNGGQASEYYYTPCAPGWTTLCDNIRSAEELYHTRINAEHHPSAGDFAWTSSYEHNDLRDIDRHIADGKSPLMNRDIRWQHELKLREHEYTQYGEIRVYTATWNVNEKQAPPDYSLYEWLTTTEEPPDIYAVAFQELDMTPTSIALTETKRDAVMAGWIEKVMAGLHPRGSYEELVAVRLVGMMLVVAVRRELRHQIRHVDKQSAGTGPMNLGNKGAVAVSLQLNEGRICFVNAHLPPHAHTHSVQQRNDAFVDITRRIQFAYDIRRFSIEEHEQIFWIGDLNYRLTQPLSREQLDLIDRKMLFQMDQLTNEMMHRRAFNTYKEGNVSFAPTYKYDPGTDTYDSSDKQRQPAWCDRVLWKGDRIVQQSYGSVMPLRLSDHKPVFGAFVCGVKMFDKEAFDRVNADVLKNVDKYENDNQPQITVEKTDVDFGSFRFNETYTDDLIVANNSHLPVEFKFLDKTGGQVCESWLTVVPTGGKLVTGKSMSIQIRLRIDESNVHRMNGTRKDVDDRSLDILVLHVANGADKFITIKGDYRPSCFGLSVESMVRLERPIAQMDMTDLHEVISRSERINTLPQTIQIPREFYLLLDYLQRNGMQTPHLFRANREHRNDADVNVVRDQLDTWSARPEAEPKPQAVAEALLLLLESSPEPLVGAGEHECLNATTAERRREIVESMMSPTRRNVFLYVCMFLVELLKRQRENLCSLETLAKLFGNAMLRGKFGNPSRMSPVAQDILRTEFMKSLLEEDVAYLSEKIFGGMVQV